MSHRTLLIAVWVAWIAVAAHLARDVPDHQGVNYIGMSVYPEHGIASLNQHGESPHESDLITFSKIWHLDLESGELRSLFENQLAFVTSLTHDGKMHWLVSESELGVIRLGDSSETGLPMRWVITDVRSEEVLESFPHRFRPRGHRDTLGGRYLVDCQTNQILIKPIDPVGATRKYAAPKSAGGITWLRRFPELRPVPGQPIHFLVFRNADPKFQLMRIDEGGELVVVETFVRSMEVGDWYARVGVAGDQFAYLNEEATSIEVRQLPTGERIRSIPLDPSLDWKNVPARFSGCLFGFDVGGSLQLINWMRGRELPIIDTDDQHWYAQQDCFSVADPKSRRVFDAETGMLLGVVSTPEPLDVFAPRTAYTTTTAFGWTVNRYDLATGKRTGRWRPFGYAFGTLAALMILLAIWYPMWVAKSAAGSSSRHAPIPADETRPDQEVGRRGRSDSPAVASDNSAWIDGLMVVVPLFALCAYRIESSGMRLVAERVEYQYAQGIVMACGVASVLWILFGSTRWLLRTLPLLLIVSVVTSVLAVLFRHHPQTAWIALGSALLPVAIMAVPLAVMRWFGWRWEREHTDESAAAESSWSRVHLRDLFSVTVLLSVCFASLRLISAGIDGIIDIRMQYGPLFWFLFAAFLTLWATVTARTIVWRVFSVVIAGSFGYLCISYLARFASGSRFYDADPFLPGDPVQRVLMTFGVMLFVMLMPYRVRGWRFRRPPRHRAMIESVRR